MNVLAMIMAGGESPGLGVLTAVRAEPAAPFGGKYRVIDFALSNCVNSGIYNVAVLTQYQPRSLNAHIGIGKPWDLDRALGGVHLLQPFQNRRGEPGAWQEGTADAVRFNLDFVTEQKAEHVLILGGDHIYKMDYNPMLRLHVESDADVTLAVHSVNPSDTHRFGMVTLDAKARVVSFEEKPPRHPTGTFSLGTLAFARARSTLASMGIYIFKRAALVDWLTGAGRAQHDFGREVIPSLVPRGRVFGYTFQGYWADVGNIQAYWEANMSLLAETPVLTGSSTLTGSLTLDLYDPALTGSSTWVIHTRSEERAAALIGAAARVDGSLLCDGCRIDGTVLRAVISPGVYVAPGAVVRDAIVMNDTVIGAGAILDRVIVDKQVTIGENARVGAGDDNTPNQLAPQRLNTGITVIGKRTHLPAEITIGRNVEIYPHLPENAFPLEGIKSGETVMG